MVKFIHTADLHLDTPFSGLEKWDKSRAEVLKKANNDVFENIIQLCIREKVDFLVIAGDVFDSEENSLEAQLLFNRGLRKLEDHNIPAYVVCGNHDPLSDQKKILKIPANTYVFPANQPETKKVVNSAGEPVASITGVSHDSEAVSENLAAQYPEGDPKLPSIAVLHGNLSGNTEHEPYAPFRMEDLQKSHIDYWALGHIHKRELLSDQDPAVVYPGNPQGRHFGETGEKGCYVVSLEKGQKPHLDFRPCMNALFDYLTIDVSGIGDWPELIDHIGKNLSDTQPELPFLARIKLSGRTLLHAELQSPERHKTIIEQTEENYTGDRLFIDKIIPQTQPEEDLKEREQSGDFAGEVLRSFTELNNDHEELEKIFASLSEEMSATLPGKKFPPVLDEEEKQEVIERARWMFFDQFNQST